jgi:hypothetical protein
LGRRNAEVGKGSFDLGFEIADFGLIEREFFDLGFSRFGILDCGFRIY